MRTYSAKINFFKQMMMCGLTVVSTLTILNSAERSKAIAQESIPPPPPPPPPPPMPADENNGDFAPPMPESDSIPDMGGSSPSSYSPPPNSGGGNFGGSNIKGKLKSNNLPIPTPATANTNPGKKVPPGKELVSIDFPEPTEIKDIIKAVGQWTGKNFILSKNISSKVAIISPQPVTKEEAYQAFLSALNVAGFTTVETGKIVKIVPTTAVPGASIKTFYSNSWAPMTDEMITQIIPINYLDANTLWNQLRNVVRMQSIVALNTTNSLIAADTGHKVRKLLEIIRLLDVKANAPQIAIEQLKNTDAAEISKKVNEVYAAKGNNSSLYMQRLLVDDRTNSLILIGPPRGLDDVVRFIRRLDRPTDDAGNQAQVHVRPLDYADAEKLATTLSALASAAGKGTAAKFPPATTRTSGGSTGVSVADLGGVKVSADKATNSLIVQSSKAAFNELDTIIKLLDKRRDQVYIEADIIDVNLGNQLNLGMSVLAGATLSNNRFNVPFGWMPGTMAPFAINRKDATAADGIDLMKAIPSQAILGVLGKQSIDIGGVQLSPGAFIFALKSDSNSNVLQTPSLLVADNEEANFDSTEREFLRQTTTDPTTKIISEKYEPLEASLNLKIKPQISKTEYVNMELTLKAESFGRRDQSNRVEQVNKRSTNTKVTVQNQQTIVMSGLSRDIDIEGKSKVPLLGDIPIIGWLFRNTNNVKQKTNLTIFITPYVVRDAEDLAKIYDKKIKERDEFLRAFYGDNYKKRDIFSRMPGPEDGKPKPSTRIEVPTPEPVKTKAIDSNKLPSEDPNPIVVPGGVGGGGGGGGSYAPPTDIPPPPPSMPNPEIAP